MDIEDFEQLLEYLETHHEVERHAVSAIELLAGGVSNRTVLVRRKGGADWVLKQALEKLRVREDWFSDPKRIHREAEGMRVLKSVTPPGVIIPLVFEDYDRHIIAMEAVPQPHTNWKSDLLQGDVSESLVIQFGQSLAGIHSSFDLQTYPESGMLRDRSFFESLRVEPYYLRTLDRVPASSVFMQELIKDTRERSLTLVHGDYSPKNVLVFNGRMVLLDHEVIHIGDPAFDLGFSMTHLLSKANHLERHRSAFLNAARLYWRTYREAIGKVSWKHSVEPMAVRHTLGCMLARVAGRSPLEYLDEEAQRRQKEWVIRYMDELPISVIKLIQSYEEYLR